MAEKRPRGRPSIYSDELAQRIAVHVSYGASLEIAARAEGVGVQTVYDWRAERPDFSERIETAKASSITVNLRRLNAVADSGDTKAITWLLARLAPDLYAEPPKRMTVEGREGSSPALVLEVRHVPRGDENGEGDDGDGNGSDHDQG